MKIAGQQDYGFRRLPMMQRAVVSGDRTLQRKEFERQEFKKHKDCQAMARIVNGYRTWNSECRGMNYDFYKLIYDAHHTILPKA